MKKSFIIASGFALGCLLIISLTLLIAQDDVKDEPAPQPTTVGLNVAYVDMLKIIKYYPEWFNRVKELKEQKDEYQNKLIEIEKELTGMYEQLSNSAEPNPLKFQEWKKNKNFYEYRKKQWENELQMLFRSMFKEIYNDVYDAIISFAEKHKFDQVLGISEREINVGTESEFLQKISLRAVVYYHQENDITNEIIKILGGDPNKRPGEEEKKPAETTEPPKTPETPENPETPKTPENPETPKAPENPTTPENPETPKAPETPANNN